MYARYAKTFDLTISNTQHRGSNAWGPSTGTHLSNQNALRSLKPYAGKDFVGILMK